MSYIPLQGSGFLLCSFFLIVSLCVCVHVVCFCACVYVCVCWLEVSDKKLDCSLPYFLRQCLSLRLELADLLILAG